MRKGKYDEKDIYLDMQTVKIIDSTENILDFGRYKNSSILETFQGNGNLNDEYAFNKFIEYLNQGIENEHHLHDSSTLLAEAITPFKYDSNLFLCNKEESFSTEGKYLNIMPVFNDRTFLSQQLDESLWNFRDFCYYTLKIRTHYFNYVKCMPQGDPTYIKWLITNTKNIIFYEKVLEDLEKSFFNVINKVEAKPISPGVYTLNVIFEKRKYKFSETVRDINYKKLKRS